MTGIRSHFLALLAVLSTAMGLPGGVGAQTSASGSTSEGWNTPRVLELVELGRLSRRQLVVDGTLRSYEARVDGHIYFFLDPDLGEQILMRVDQVAVELYWTAPDGVIQRVVGERSETRLPVRDFQYYPDRLTLVEHGFGEEIRIGSGLDVAGVPHPLAQANAADPDSSPYDFRLADSVSIVLPNRDETLRVYEIEVRPRDAARPGIVGTFALEGETASIVRMAFSFTPSSYIDPRTDRILVSLEYGLWEGRYWLPNEQRLEVRREIPQLDLGLGTVIRSVLRTGDYELNQPIPDEVLRLPPVTAASATERELYPFPEGLYDAIGRDGLAEIVLDPDLRALRTEARTLAVRQARSGLAPARLHFPSLSSGVRFNRVEGLYLGAGLSFSPNPPMSGEIVAGYAFGAKEPQGFGRLRRRIGDRTSLAVEGRYRSLVELGLAPGSDPLLSTLGGTVRGEDYRDPYLSTGAQLTLSHATESATEISVGVGLERARTPVLVQSSAPLDESRSFRPIRPVADGDFLSLELSMRRGVEWPSRGRGRSDLGLHLLTGDAGTGAGFSWEVEGRWGQPAGVREMLAIARGWHWVGDPLPQGHRLLGGRGTVPGHPFHGAMGRTALQGSLVASTDLGGPFFRLRAGLHAGWTDRGHDALEARWKAGETRRVLTSASIGLGLAWDLLRIELARGFSGGDWEVLLTTDPRWWDRL